MADIKPSNILLCRNGQVKLCDFGVSGEFGTKGDADTFIGTSYYMAPERITGQSYTITSDVWSLGVTLLEVAQHRFPFPADGTEMQPRAGLIDLLTYIVRQPIPKLKDEPEHGIKWSESFKYFIECSYVLMLLCVRWGSLTECLQARKRSLAPRHALADAGTSLDCGNAGQAGQHGTLSQASLGLEGLRNGTLGWSEYLLSFQEEHQISRLHSNAKTWSHHRIPRGNFLLLCLQTQPLTTKKHREQTRTREAKRGSNGLIILLAKIGKFIAPFHRILVRLFHILDLAWFGVRLGFISNDQRTVMMDNWQKKWQNFSARTASREREWGGVFLLWRVVGCWANISPFLGFCGRIISSRLASA